MSKQKVRQYYHPINRDVFVVRVLSRKRQETCGRKGHEFRERLWSEQNAGWDSVCKNCGGTARGKRW